ncbi:MAG: hypothetical protein LC734_05660 [Acidobacteria bacterium]|nr:hypothetical protein [Acidobacteriota bacterium]
MNNRRLELIFLVITTLAAPGAAQSESASVAFWNELQKLCGKAFAGVIAADTANSPDFAGKPLVMHVRSCERDRIRIPFFVGGDRSRTWVLTRGKDGRIQLKHDHRHADGKPDAVTMYGGMSTNSGMRTRQFFPADEETVRVVPAPANNAPSAAANVWWIDLVAGDHFAYNLRRLGGDRLFSVRFDLKKEIKQPPPPWGWKD